MGKIPFRGATVLLILIGACILTGVVTGDPVSAEEELFNSWSTLHNAEEGLELLQNPNEHADSDITVCESGCDYTTIQAAIDGSTDGDSILVYGGSYPESLLVNKSLWIRGTNGTVLVGDPDLDYAAETTSDMVILENLTLSPVKKNGIQIGGNMTGLFDLDCTGQDPEDPFDAVISGNDIYGVYIGRNQMNTSARYGVSCINTSKVMIYDNSITVGRDPDLLNMAIDISYGLLDQTGSDYYILNNSLMQGGISVCTENNQGEDIVFPEMDMIHVINNTISCPNWWGIDVGGFAEAVPMHIHNVTISGNQVTGARTGYSNLFCRAISGGSITNNTVCDFPVDGAGIVLKDLDSFLIRDNQVMDGTVSWMSGFSGFMVSTVRNSVILNNRISNVYPFSFNFAPGMYLSPNLTFDSTNTADGKSVIYREGMSDLIIDSENAAMVVLMSCTNSTVHNTVVNNSGLGIGVYNGTGIRVTDNRITDTNTGMMLIESSDSLTQNNSFIYNWMGLGVGTNRAAKINQNKFLSYSDSGIVLHTGEGCSINVTNNSFNGYFSGKDQAIVISDSNGEGVYVTNNTITHNTRGILISESFLNTIQDNLIQGCGIGMNLLGAQNNRFFGNRILNTDDYSEGLYVISSDAFGGGRCINNTFLNNYVMSVRPVNVSTIHNSIETFGLQLPERWGSVYEVSGRDEPEEDTYPNVWNISKTEGRNIVNGSYLGGNFYATPDGTGWSQIHPDRGDGFVGEPYVFDSDNVDYLPLHLPGSPTPTSTPTPTPTPTQTPTPTVTPTPTPTPTPVILSANFTANPVTGTPPLTIGFTDTSTGHPATWNWTFGDGTISHDQNPIHTYTGIGRYTVTLEVSNTFGQSVMQKSSYITPNAGRFTGPTGIIQVTSEPDGAEVFVDGIRIGMTPVHSAGIPAGMREIQVSMDGYREWKGTVFVGQGEFTLVPKVILRKKS